MPNEINTTAAADVTTAIDDASAALDDSDWSMFAADMGAEETGEEIAW